MEVSPVRSVSQARKEYRCSWCNETIKTGTSYKKWFTYGENVTARMHPECYDAMLDADLYDEMLSPAGTYPRGCSCGEYEEFCECLGRIRKEAPDA